jgi:hypothetical protein
MTIAISCRLWYTIIVPRERAQAQHRKKVFEKLKKPLDKLHRLCYNKDTVKERKVKREVKKSFKTLKKVLDKPPDLWYNTYRKTRTV